MKTYDITLTVTIDAVDTDEAIGRVSSSVFGDDRVTRVEFDNAKEVK